MSKSPLYYLHKILDEYPELRKYSTFELAFHPKSIDPHFIDELEANQSYCVLDENNKLYLIYDLDLDINHMQIRVFTDNNDIIRSWTDVTIDNENDRVYFTSLINHDDNNNVTS